MLEEIKIRYSRWQLWLVLLTGLMMVYATLYALIYVDLETYLITFCCLVMFCMGLVGLSLSLKRIMSKNKYALIASREGLWLEDFGLIPWASVNNIDYFVQYKHEHQGMTGKYYFVHIKLHDINVLLPNLSWMTKLRLYSFFLSDKNSIFLSGLEMHPIIAAQKLHNFMEQQKNN